MNADLKQKNLAFLSAMSSGNVDAAYVALLSIFDPPSYVALGQFESALKQNLEDWLLLQNDHRTQEPAVWYETLRRKSMAGLIANNMATVRRHGLYLPDIVVRYYRALTIIDVILLELDPSVNIREEFQVFINSRC